jgi:hypothetical protein
MQASLCLAGFRRKDLRKKTAPIMPVARPAVAPYLETEKSWFVS